MPDVVVIGGGPAGSTAATLLAAAGVDVLVCERERFPRPHVGESLLPATLAILDEIGVLPAVEAEGFVTKHGATMCWGRQAEPWSWYFKETNRRHPHSYQVWRPRFDQILLDHAKTTGATVREGVAVRAVEFDGERAVGVRLADGARIRAAMVVDASGQQALLARQRRLLGFDPFFRNLAVYGYFAGAPHLDAPDDGNIFIESHADGWTWKIPLAGGVSSVGAVVDRDVGAGRIRRAGLAAFYREQIRASPRVAAMLRGLSPAAAPAAVRDWSYVACRMAGPGHVLAGDAACFVDPLFSTGVHLAVSGAHMAAAYVVSALAEPDIAEAAAVAYERMYRTQYEHFFELAKLFYAGNRSVDSYFWAARRITGEEARSPREAFVRAVSGQTAAGYERSVLSRGELPPAFEQALAGMQRRPEVADAGRARPRLAPGLELARAAVLGDGRFRWGYVVRGAGRAVLPVSTLVAHLLHGVDAERSVDEIAVDVAARNGLPAERVRPLFEDAARLLVRDRVLLCEEREGG